MTSKKLTLHRESLRRIHVQASLPQNAEANLTPFITGGHSGTFCHTYRPTCKNCPIP